MSVRLSIFRERCENHWQYRRLVKRLTEAEFDMIVDFIDDNDGLGHLEFEYAVNRMFLHADKPKNWSIIQELLLLTNTAAKAS